MTFNRRSGIQRLLIVRNDRLGDLILTLPAIEAARRALPQAYIAVLVSPYAAGLLENNPHCDAVLIDDPAGRACDLARRLRPLAFDTAAVITPNTRNCLAVWRAGIHRRVCWAHKPAGLIFGNRRLFVHRSRPPLHEAEFALRFLRPLGLPASLADCSPRLHVAEDARRSVLWQIHRELGTRGPLFGIHPGSKNSAYNWPIANYARLAESLSSHGRVVISGSPAEAGLLEQLHSQLSLKARSRVALCTNWSLAELVAAIAELDALTVSSTGPMHIAGVVGTPVAALFSPHPAHVPRKWAPLGSGHAIFTAPLLPGESAEIPAERAAEVMSRITVEQVLEANLRLARAGQALAS